MNDTAVCICCHDDCSFLEAVIHSFSGLPVTVFISNKAWDGSRGNPETCVEVVRRAGAEVVLGEWDNESDHRRFALATMRERGVRWLFVPDSDEIIERRLLDRLLALSQTGVWDHYRVRMHTYWKSVRYRIHPPEEIAPVLLIDAQKCEHQGIREYSHESSVVLGFEHGALHHLSYAGSNERISRKVLTWGHRAEVIAGWYEDVWLGWDDDRTMRNLHPTHPVCYGFAARSAVPEILRTVEDPRPALLEPPVPAHWKKISVVIPLYGGPELIHACLESLRTCGVSGDQFGSKITSAQKGKGRKGVKAANVPDRTCPDLVYEVIVVDDCSPDNAAEVASQFPFVKLLKNESNVGFGESCNRGFRASTGDLVLFLNSDTRLPRAALIRLAETVLASGTVGAAGPLTNHAGYEQGISPTLVDLENLERFACDFADRDVSDKDTSMLVGFCLLVRRTVLEEVGLFDPAFGKGLFEDTDLVYRIQRANYRTRISSRSYVHHEGSKSLARTGEHPSLMLARNRQVYQEKWRLDQETGFASHLAGEKPERILFNPDREPRLVIQELRKMAHKLGISVCMIVRDEERVIESSLRSLLNVFPQVVVMDTGSTDNTMEIARGMGVEVHEMEWPDSFSVARNASIECATGKWIFWIDADDTVPFQTLEAIILSVWNAPAIVNGFVVPVQFVGDVPGSGTRVDHVKVFRNDPRHRFEGRIHENILSSLRSTGGELGRIHHPVLHSGYDNSPEGQRKKRIRDRKLLALDLKDRPGHPFCLFNLGMTAFFCGRFRVAIGWLRRSIRNSSPGDSHVRKAYTLYAQALAALGRLEESVEVEQAGLQMVGEDPELRFNLAGHLAQLGRFAEAREGLLAMKSDTSGFFSSLDIGILTFRKLLELGKVCFAMGLEGESKQHLREAISANPRFPGSAVALFDVSMRTGDIVTAREAADAMRQAEGTSEQWALMRAAIADLAGIGADQELIRLTQETPQSIGPGTVLARRMLQSGNVQAALPLLSHLEALGCAEAAHHLGTHALAHGALEDAGYHTRLCLQLAPGSIDSLRQLERVELAMDDLLPLPEFTGGSGSEVLVGPHMGLLGPASLERTVVVVTFNSESTITECLERVLRTLSDQDELIVVDNASADGTLALVQGLSATHPHLIVLPQSENLGYSRACNVGVLASRAARIVALNPDAFVKEGWLEAMEAQLVGSVAAVGPVSDSVAGDQFVGHFLGERRPRSEELAAIMGQEQRGVVKTTKMLMGVCLMMRRDLLDQHGLLCEETSLGADDLEFSWRFRELGFDLAVVPAVFVRHIGSASFATVPSIETRKKVRRSDRALMRRLKAYYGESPIPSSYDLWGCEIFAEAMATIQA